MKSIIRWALRTIPRPVLQRIAGSALKVTGLFYRGSAVTCPVCSTSFRRFLPFGRNNPRANALCPQCMSLERHRLIWLYLQTETELLRLPSNILHIAPEACFIPRLEAIHHEKYITADLESPLAKVKMDIHAIPFEANHFDAVICNHVLEHVNNDLLAMSEMARVLKPGGLAILQVPFFHPIPDVTTEDPSLTDPAERIRLFGQDDHVRRYGKDYTERIRQSGLIPIADPYVNQLTPETQQKYGLVPGEILYLGKKPNGQ